MNTLLSVVFNVFFLIREVCRRFCVESEKCKNTSLPNLLQLIPLYFDWILRFQWVSVWVLYELNPFIRKWNVRRLVKYFMFRSIALDLWSFYLSHGVFDRYWRLFTVSSFLSSMFSILREMQFYLISSSKGKTSHFVHYYSLFSSFEKYIGNRLKQLFVFFFGLPNAERYIENHFMHAKAGKKFDICNCVFPHKNVQFLMTLVMSEFSSLKSFFFNKTERKKIYRFLA